MEELEENDIINLETLIDIAETKFTLAKRYKENYTTQDKALELFQESINCCNTLLKLNIEEREVLVNRGTSQVEIADIYESKGQTELSLKFLNQGIDDYIEVLKLNNKNINTLNYIGNAYCNMASVYKKQIKFEEVKRYLNIAIKTYEEILDVETNNLEAINGIANAKIDLGELYIEFGKYNKALNILEDSIADSIKSLKINRENNRDALHNQALGFFNIGKIFAIDGRAKKALEYFNQSIDYYNLILSRKENDTLILNHRALVYDDISELYRDLEDREKANEFYLKALYDYNTILKQHKNHIYATSNKVKTVSDYLHYNRDYINKSEQLNIINELITHCDHVLKSNPNHFDAINNKLVILSELAKVYDDMGDSQMAIKLAYQELEEYQEILKVYPYDTIMQNNAGVGKLYLSEYLLDRGQTEEALYYLKDAIPNYDTALLVNPEDIVTLMNKSLTLKEIDRLIKDEVYLNNSVVTNYKILELYDKYFFSVEDERDIFHLVEKMLYPLSKLLYSSYNSTVNRNQLILKSIELVKAKTLKQMLSLAVKTDLLHFDNQEKREKLIKYIDNIKLLEKEIRQITININRQNQEILSLKKSTKSIKKEIDFLDIKSLNENENEKREDLYQKLNIYKNKLSSLLLNKELYKDNSYEIADIVLDEESVILYPFCYIYPSYYDRKPELSVVSVFKKNGRVLVKIHYEVLNKKIFFSDYIYFIREVENLFDLINTDISSNQMKEKLDYFNKKFSTVDNEIIKKVFILDKKMEIISLKISKNEFAQKYKYKIIQKALSFVQDICIKSIPKGIKKIYFSPLGDLNLLPLHALSTGENSYLIEKYEIAYIPFLSILDKLKPKDNIKKDLVISADIKELGEKNNLHDEAISCSQILTTKPHHNINTVEFKKMVHNQKYNIIHLSTHGLSDLNNPLNSYLLFKDSHLSLLEIHGLKLDINLVVLSACETNLSKLKGADEVLAFERAFLIAGARNIITTFSTVNIIRTRDFMEEFYSNIKDKESISSTFQQTCIEDIRADSKEWMLFRFTGS